MVRLVVAALALSACIEAPAFERCGELACPTGTSCVADRCVTSEQLAACAGFADGDVCSIDNAIGACANGICDAIGCGNSRVDLDEACDDGNTTFGDGCSGDCRSAETCGNGIVDVASGETCDCGTPDRTRPTGCQFPNSAALEAECTESCELRYCGNDVLDRLEQCDGTERGDAECADFGYYAGTLGCLAACRYDTTSCIGRCGDLNVDPVYGEFCDGSPPEGTCLTFDFDAGTLGCSSTCTPAVDRCERFGWQLVDAAAPRSLWARGPDTLMIAADSSSAWMAISGLREPAPAGTYRVATGANGGDAYALGDTQVAVWNGLEWSQLTAPWGVEKPTSAWASTTLGLYVVTDGGNVWRYEGGTWSAQALANIIGVSGDEATVFAWSASAVSTSAGGAWSPLDVPGSGAINAFVSAGGTQWLGRGGQNIYRRTTGDWTGPFVHSFTQMTGATTGDLLLAPSLRRLFGDDRPSDVLTAPGGVTRVASSTFEAGIIAVAGSKTYRLRTGAWASNYYIYDNTYLADADSFHIGSAGGRAIHAGDIAWYAPPGSDFYDFAYYQPTYFYDFTETVDQSLVFATDEYGESGLWVFDVYGTPTLAVSGDFLFVHNARNGEIIATGGSTIAAGGVPTWDAGWVSHLITGYTLGAVERRTDDSFVVAARRTADGQYLLLSIATDGAATELAGSNRSTPWNDVWLAPDDTIYAVSGTTLWIAAPGQTATTQDFSGATLQTVSGTDRDDVFVGGSGASFSGFSGMAHFDGTAWMPVRVASNTRVFHLHVSDTLISYVFAREQFSLQRVIRW